ncbi:hypothetical protein LTR86_003328 [Recurvomyces mirabilis]|nr:hypothetical protein LTR86_003328 [Recurvomyces mirabilis]
MATDTYAEQHIALINHLLAEKDRLILEKDELVASKDRMWRELSVIVRERDAEIAQLRHASLIRASTSDAGPEPQDTSMSDEVRGLKQRNAALEQALQDLLDDTSDEEGGKAFDLEIDQSGGSTVKMECFQDDSGSELFAGLESDFPKDGNSSPPQHPAALRRYFAQQSSASRDLGQPGCSAMTSSSGTLQPDYSLANDTAQGLTTRFTFAPLIDSALSGSRDLGNIGRVAPLVLQSVNEQAQLHQQRVIAKTSIPFPTKRFHSTGCMWYWMHKCTSETVWTTDRTRDYACAACFNARRVCLFWCGKGRWILLPLPPQVRSAGATWEDDSYYIAPGEAVASRRDYPGVWLTAKSHKKK